MGVAKLDGMWAVVMSLVIFIRVTSFGESGPVATKHLAELVRKTYRARAVMGKLFSGHFSKTS